MEVIISRPTRILSYLTELAAVTPKVGNARVAAAIVNGGRIISIATNKRKTHTVQARFGKNAQAVYLHAEVAAIIQALKRVEVAELEGCDIYVARVAGVKREVAKVEPCAGCARAIADFKLRRIYCT